MRGISPLKSLGEGKQNWVCYKLQRIFLFCLIILAFSLCKTMAAHYKNHILSAVPQGQPNHGVDSGPGLVKGVCTYLDQTRSSATRGAPRGRPATNTQFCDPFNHNHVSYKFVQHRER